MMGLACWGKTLWMLATLTLLAIVVPIEGDAATAMVCDDAPPSFKSFHIHVLFWQADRNHTLGALKIRQDFTIHFNLEGKNCTMSAGDPAPDAEMCLFEVDRRPVGPFTTGQYSFFIPRSRYAETTEWILQNRGVYDVLIHPNTGCETNDHTKWALWAGHSWPIDSSIFSCNFPGCVPHKY